MPSKPNTDNLEEDAVAGSLILSSLLLSGYRLENPARNNSVGERREEKKNTRERFFVIACVAEVTLEASEQTSI